MPRYFQGQERATIALVLVLHTSLSKLAVDCRKSTSISRIVAQAPRNATKPVIAQTFLSLISFDDVLFAFIRQKYYKRESQEVFIAESQRFGFFNFSDIAGRAFLGPEGLPMPQIPCNLVSKDRQHIGDEA